MDPRNLLSVFKTVQKKNLISRTDISKLTHLSESTISRCVSRLLEKNILVEKRLGKSSGGRPPILLDINSEGPFSVGIEVGETHVDVVAINAYYKILKSESKVVPKDISIDALVDEIYDTFTTLISTGKISREKIISVGLGLPGIVSKDQKKLLLTPNSHFETFPSSDVLQRILDIPVFYDNGANLMVFSEYHLNKLSPDSILLGVIIGTGIGAGLVVREEIFRGSNGASLEVGHTVIMPDGPECRCGRHGCVEALASVPKLIESYNAKSNDIKINDIKELHELFSNGDALAKDVLEQEAYYLALLLANLANIVNPSRIFIGGEITPVLPNILEQIRKHFSAQVLPTNTCDIRISKLDQVSIAHGAAIMAMEKEIESYF
ncbi:MAG TPA: ROK family protein [Fervidobacterium sp.]|nr:ROK family protein [Fervidobacterium sp.]